MKKIFITGGAGYVGSFLVPKLLQLGYYVTVLDLMIYGEEVLDHHKNLKVIKGDIRDQNLVDKSVKGSEIFIHLACISNDPSFELNPKLGKSINLDSFEPLVKIAKKNNLKKFIYASSSSVYGVKSENNVHEEMSLEPLTDYSKFKAECETILNNNSSNNFTTVTIRPATVCGYAKRQRLDVVVNILTNLAFHKREITIFGGSQLRPNIHIEDMAEVYVYLIEADDYLINGKIYNAGYENHSVLDLAKTVVEVIGSDVLLKKMSTNDLRSYHISSDKIKNELGFVPKKTIKDAVSDLRFAFENKLLINTLENENYFNIKKMNKINLA